MGGNTSLSAWMSQLWPGGPSALATSLDVEMRRPILATRSQLGSGRCLLTHENALLKMHVGLTLFQILDVVCLVPKAALDV